MDIEEKALDELVTVVWKWKWSRSVVYDSLWPVDCSPPSSPVHGILQARILEWVAISFSYPSVGLNKKNLSDSFIIYCSLQRSHIDSGPLGINHAFPCVGRQLIEDIYTYTGFSLAVFQLVIRKRQPTRSYYHEPSASKGVPGPLLRSVPI